MLISKLMQTKLVLATPECKFKALLCKIGKLTPRQIYIVNEEMKLEGIITGYDLLKEVMPYYLDAKLARTIQEPEINDYLKKCIEKVEDKKAKDIMITNFVYLKPTDHIMEAEAVIVEKGFNSLPVLNEEKRLVGEVNRRDILSYFSTICDYCSLKSFQTVDVSQIDCKDKIKTCYSKLIEEEL